MSSSTPSAGSSYAQSKDTIMMQNLRSYSCSIVKLKLGANEAQWRADVLAASSLYGADHLLSGVHLSLTQEQYDGPDGKNVAIMGGVSVLSKIPEKKCPKFQKNVQK